MNPTAAKSLVCLLLFGVLCSVQECFGEPQTRVKRDHKPGHPSSAAREAKLMVLADSISYFLNQGGCSSKVVQQFLSQKCHGSPNSNEQRATFRVVVNYLEVLPEDRISLIERKVQYGSVVVTVLSQGVSGGGGQVSYKYQDFMNHLQSSRQEYQYQQSSEMVIKYVVKYMYEVESTTYIKSSFKSLIESTYGSNGNSFDSGKSKPQKGKHD